MGPDLKGVWHSDDSNLAFPLRMLNSEIPVFWQFCEATVAWGVAFTWEFSGSIDVEPKSNPFMFYGIKVPRKALNYDMNGALGAFVSKSKSQKNR